MQDIIKFQPIYQERVWGGRGLESSLGRTLPADKVIGESWEVVDRPEAQSVVSIGSDSGRSIREILENEGDSVMGPLWDKSRPFPILIKWLDCQDRLSLQVHPPAAIAGELKGEPKTENWFIADAQPGSQLIVGLKQGATKAGFEKALADDTVEGCVHRFPVKPGDSILVHSGSIHAIDAGNLILEIQQNSDTTYRVYDWGRVGLDGQPRQLHIEQSLASIHWDQFEPEPVRGSDEKAVIADCAEFRIRRMPLVAGETMAINAQEQPRLVSMVKGTLAVGGSGERLVKGDNALLPYAGAFTLTATEDSLVLITENFC